MVKIRNYKKFLILLFLFVALGISSWFIFYTYATRWLEGRIDSVAESLREKGYVISYSTLKISGNPLSIQATLKNPHFKDPLRLVDWQGEEVKIHMRLWSSYTLQCDFLGEQRIVTPRKYPFPLEALQLEGAIATLYLNAQGKIESLNFKIDRLTSIFQGKPQQLALKDFSLNINNFRDPLNLKIAFSTQLINVEKLLNMEQKKHPFEVNIIADFSGFKSNLPFPSSLAEWRDGGGVLEVRLLKINWPPILAEIEGTLTLDQEMYPLGAFSSRIYGYREGINDMVKSGLVKKKKATVALFMLDLFSSADEQGKTRLMAPITLQNKVFSIGPAPLFKLSPLIH